MTEPSHANRFLAASDLYNLVEFQTDSIYNESPPSPLTTLVIGCIMCSFAFVLWIRRVLTLRKELQFDIDADAASFSLRLRGWLTAYTENDCAVFTCVRMAGQSFLLLAGLQLNYLIAFLVMLCFFSLESCCDSLRVLLALREANSLDELVVTSKFLRADLRKHPLTTTLVPTNVYEDLTRDSFVVGMVFVTQILLIVFVVADVLAAETHNCLDGTANCPVTGTLGSWGFYVLGIFMACVFHLGPKTNFGRNSEQNPAFWLKLFMCAKQGNNSRKGSPPTCYSWYDPIEDIRKSSPLQGNFYWVRFVMSFLINGVGFHILVHTLPIQIAAANSLTGVVARAVGMLYLVNLDNTSGYEMTILGNNDNNKEDDATEASTASFYSYFGGGRKGDGDDDEEDDLEVAKAAEKIIVKAQAALDSLKYKRKKRKANKTKSRSSRGSKTTTQAEF